MQRIHPDPRANQLAFETGTPTRGSNPEVPAVKSGQKCSKPRGYRILIVVRTTKAKFRDPNELSGSAKNIFSRAFPFSLKQPARVNEETKRSASNSSRGSLARGSKFPPFPARFTVGSQFLPVSSPHQRRSDLCKPDAAVVEATGRRFLGSACAISLRCFLRKGHFFVTFVTSSY